MPNALCGLSEVEAEALTVGVLDGMKVRVWDWEWRKEEVVVVGWKSLIGTERVDIAVKTQRAALHRKATALHSGDVAMKREALAVLSKTRAGVAGGVIREKRES